MSGDESVESVEDEILERSEIVDDEIKKPKKSPALWRGRLGTKLPFWFDL